MDDLRPLGIRPVEERDLQPLLEILNSSIEQHHANFHWERRPMEELAEEWRASQGLYSWLVLEDLQSGRALGLAKSGRYRVRPAYNWTAEVSIYLGGEARGRGWGRKLYGELLDQLREAGIHAAFAAIALPNEASEALHASLGFTRVGNLPEVGWKAGVWRDVALWYQRLGEAPSGPPVPPGKR